MPKKESKKSQKDRIKEIEEKGIPLCEKCGNAMIIEDDEWMCPHCQGEINFLGEDD